MGIRPIVKYPSPVLREKAREVEGFTPEVQGLLKDMLETMEAAKGVGLAANQVGVPLRVFVFDPRVQEGSPLKAPMAILNPKILEASGTILWEEGCLSFPDMELKIARSERIVLDGLAQDGQPLGGIELDGLLAVCVQHEMDHLDGVLFIDHASKLKKEIALKRYLSRGPKEHDHAKAHF
jgi:peptide deformylase